MNNPGVITTIYLEIYQTRRQFYDLLQARAEPQISRERQTQALLFAIVKHVTANLNSNAPQKILTIKTLVA